MVILEPLHSRMNLFRGGLPGDLDEKVQNNHYCQFYATVCFGAHLILGWMEVFFSGIRFSNKDLFRF